MVWLIAVQLWLWCIYSLVAEDALARTDSTLWLGKPTTERSARKKLLRRIH